MVAQTTTTATKLLVDRGPNPADRVPGPPLKPKRFFQWARTKREREKEIGKEIGGKSERRENER